MSIDVGSSVESARVLARESILRFLLDYSDVDVLAPVLAKIFGEPASLDIARALSAGATEWPEIRVVADDALDGAMAAYVAGRDLILVSQSAVAIDAQEPGYLSRLLVEEYGHHLDHLFNPVDTIGDEGRAFYSAVQSQGFVIPDESDNDDHGHAIVDGISVDVEQATFSDSGGFEGSQTSIALEGTGDNSLKYSFEMYSIPDRFVVRYEGKTLLDTGFISGGMSGEVEIKRGTADTVQVFVITDDAGTAWDYSIETTGDDCPDTKPLTVTAVGGDFVHDPNKKDTCTYTGTVIIGRQDGTSSLLRVEGGTVTITKTEVSVSGGTVYAAVGGVTQPLFTGSFKIPYATGKASDLNVGHFQAIGGLEVDLEGFIVGKNEVRFDTEFALPGEIGAIQINKQTVGSDVLILNSNGLNFAGPSLKLQLPDASYKFLNLIEAKATGSSIGYSSAEDQIKFQSKLEIAAPIKGVETKISIDVLDPNFVSVQNGEVDFKGSIKFERDIELGKFKFKDFSLAIDTVAVPTTIAGTGTFELPMGARTPSVGLTLGVALDPLAINKVGFAVDNLNIPVPIKPDFFFQRLALSVDKLAPSVTDPVTVSGGVGFSYGPTINVGKVGPFDFGNFALVRGDVDVSISQDNFAGTGTVTVLSASLYKETGAVDLNWTKGTLTVSGGYEMLFGAAKGNALLKVDTAYNLAMAGTANVSIPNIDGLPSFLKGKELAGGNAALTFTNDQNLGNDWAAAWGTVTIDFAFGQQVTGVFGIRAEFDGDFDLIGANNVPTAPSASRSALVASNDADLAFAAAAAPETADYVLVVLEWTDATAARPALVVTTPDGAVISEIDFAANNIVIVEALSGAGVVTVAVGPALGETSVPTQGWVIDAVDQTGLGDVTSSTFEPAETAAVAVTDVTSQAGTIEIDYQVTSDATAGEVVLFYDDDGVGFDGTPIASGLAFTPGQVLSYTWDTSAIPTGNYHVYAAVVPEGGIPVLSGYAVNVATVGPGADLVVTTTLQDALYDSRTVDEFTYEVTVANNGQAIAKGVVFNEAFDAGSYYYYETDHGTSGSLSSESGFSIDLGDLAVGAEETVAITLYRYDPTPITVQHQSSASTTSFDADVFNNIASGKVTLAEDIGISDLSVQLVSASVDGDVGEQATYTLLVTNTGPDAATDVILNEFVEGLTTGGYYAANYQITGGAGGQISTGGSQINLGTIASGASREIVVSGTVFTSGTTISTSELSANGSFDPNFENNSLVQLRSATSAEVTLADVSLTGTVNTTSFVTGDTLTFTIDLTNAGPNSATALQVKFDLSAGIEIVSSNPGAQGTFDEGTGLWDVGNMRDGLTRTLTVTAVVNDASAQFARAQLVSVSEPDQDSTPNNGFTGEDDEVIFFGSGPITGGGGVDGPSGGGAPLFSDIFINLGTPAIDNATAPENFHGTPGIDYVVFTGNIADYTIQIGTDGLPSSILHNGVSDKFDGIERLKFADGALAFDEGAKNIYRLYEAAFDRQPDKAGITYWLSKQAAEGTESSSIVDFFAHSAEFTEKYGAIEGLSNEAAVDIFYQNILNRPGDAGGIEYWVDRLEQGLSKESLLAFFADSAENKSIVDIAIVGGVELDASILN